VFVGGPPPQQKNKKNATIKQKLRLDIIDKGK
jgi:hypothetical protein